MEPESQRPIICDFQCIVGFFEGAVQLSMGDFGG